jgi:hypothetical protein
VKTTQDFLDGLDDLLADTEFFYIAATDAKNMSARMVYWQIKRAIECGQRELKAELKKENEPCA